MKSNLIKKVLEGALIATLLVGNVEKSYAPAYDSGYTWETQRQLLWDRAVREQDADKVMKPYFKLKPSHCSQYARLSAKKLFGKKYNGADAWNLKYNNPVVYDFDKEKDVKEAILDDKLKQGMLITSRWPVKNIKKYGEEGLDMNNEPIESTHVLEYIGIGKNTDKGVLNSPEPIFIHQWGSRMERKTQKQLWDDYQLTFNKIIDDKKVE